MKKRNNNGIESSFRRGLALVIVVLVLAAGAIAMMIISGRDIRWAWPVKEVTEEK